MDPAVSDRVKRSQVLWPYFALTYAALVVNMAGYLSGVSCPSLISVLFVGAAWLSIAFLLLLPVLLALLVLNRLLSWGRAEALFRRSPKARDRAFHGAAIAGFALVQLFVYFDRFIYRLYDFHFNGFVWNLVFTKGGIDALGAGRSTKLSFAFLVLEFLALQAALLAAVLYVPRLRTLGARFFSRRGAVAVAIGLAGLVAFDKLTYGMSRFKAYTPVLNAAEALPLYIPCSFAGLAERLGFEGAKAGPTLRMDVKSRRIRYPLAPVRRDPARPLSNVVWLVAESWRWDMLDPSIMPATWSFSEKAARFRRHYSGGNGTRMGMFTMFYGLYGTYWNPFLAERRGPVLVDLLLGEGYEVDCTTSATFSYPEFDQTVFARVPPERLHEASSGASWERDRANVTRLLDFIEKRDPSRPFMTFMFFESPHGPYNFPEEAAIRKPYAPDLNYLTMDLKKDIGLIKNRYVNACRHLDSQFARILAFLEERRLLDSTIVVITGDHGEEFMEKGKWGHASTFSEEQTRVPLVLWAPGRPPAEVTRLTSHLDLPATVMALLGVTNPPEEYSAGCDLFGPKAREFAVFSGWDHIAYVDEKYKADLPIKTYDLVHRKVTTRDDQPLADRAAFFQERQAALLQVMRDLGRFLE